MAIQRLRIGPVFPIVDVGRHTGLELVVEKLLKPLAGTAREIGIHEFLDDKETILVKLIELSLGNLHNGCPPATERPRT